MFNLFKKDLKKEVNEPVVKTYPRTIIDLFNDPVQENFDYPQRVGQLIGKITIVRNEDDQFTEIKVSLFKYNNKLLIYEGAGVGYISKQYYSNLILRLLISTIIKEKYYTSIISLLLERCHYNHWNGQE